MVQQKPNIDSLIYLLVARLDGVQQVLQQIRDQPPKPNEPQQILLAMRNHLVKLDVIQKVLQEIRDRQAELPRISGKQGVDEVLIRRVRVETAGTPVRGPEVPIPKGYRCIIRQRRHIGANPTGYVAFSKGSVGSSEFRVELSDGDSLEVMISCMESAWFDSNTNNTDFEMIVEL